MFSARPIGLEKLTPTHSWVDTYVMRSNSLSRITILTVPALASLDLAYHTTALILKSLRVVVITVFRLKTASTGPRQHLKQVVNAVIAVTYPLIGLVSLNKLSAFHNYLSPKQNKWHIGHVAGTIGVISCASLATWYAWPTPPPPPSSLAWCFNYPVLGMIFQLAANFGVTSVFSKIGQQELRSETAEAQKSPKYVTGSGRLAPYKSLIGVAVGLLTGIAFRTLTGVPLDFKLAKGISAAPFGWPVLNQVNSCMQIMIKGPLKYVFPFPAVPLMMAAGRGVKHLSWETFKHDVRPMCNRQTARVATSTALAATLAATQGHWSSLVQIPGLQDLSGHVLMSTTIASSQGLAVEAAMNAGCDNRVMSVSCFTSAALGVANGLFMFNTATQYHTVPETMAGCALSTLTIVAGVILVPPHARVDGVAKRIPHKRDSDK